MPDPDPHRTLTFGDDGSPAADVAWLCINSHAWPGWRLDVVTAQPPAIGAPPRRGEIELHEWTPPQARKPFVETRFAEIRQLTAVADPRLALMGPCELLVIGPRGPGLLKSLHLGSTADWLLSHPPAPLLIARHGRAITTVLACVDGSRHAAAAIAALATLPWVPQTDVTVLAVDDGRVDTAAALDAAESVLGTTGATVRRATDRGSPTSLIHEQVERRVPDLVVLGTRGLTGLHRLRVGSTANAVARTAPCSVLVACNDEPDG